MNRRTLVLTGSQALEYLKALGSDKRLEILELLENRILNVQQIAEALNLTQPTVTMHIQKLEEAGLIRTTFKRGQRGTQKTCASLFDEIVVRLTKERDGADLIPLEIIMPFGAFTSYSVQPTCGLAHSGSIIGLLDSAEAFGAPERTQAGILWFAKGFVEYTFPRAVPPLTLAARLDLSAEVCSEVAGWDNSWKSDITVWINDVDIGTWTSPGDFGGERGRLNPSWWQDRYSQFGLLKNWTVDERGSFVDGLKISNVVIGDLGLEAGPIRVRLGNKSSASYAGGVTFFGATFGNYQQDLLLRLMYRDVDARQPVGTAQKGVRERPAE